LERKIKKDFVLFSCFFNIWENFKSGIYIFWPVFSVKAARLVKLAEKEIWCRDLCFYIICHKKMWLAKNPFKKLAWILLFRPSNFLWNFPESFTSHFLKKIGRNLVEYLNWAVNWNGLKMANVLKIEIGSLPYIDPIHIFD